jgi:uncharacterized protein YlxW (UPF0749 family)
MSLLRKPSPSDAIDPSILGDALAMKADQQLAQRVKDLEQYVNESERVQNGRLDELERVVGISSHRAGAAHH